MVTFIGKQVSKVDDKGRLVFPSPFKALLPDGADRRFVIKKSLYSNCLEMWPFEEWSRQTEQIRQGLDYFNPQHELFWREYLRDCDIVEPDSKLGRISISGYLLDAIGVTKEVVFFGVNYKIEIWAAEQFEAARLSKEEFVAIAKSLSRK